MLAFSIDYYGIFFRATQSVELFCTYILEEEKWLEEFLNQLPEKKREYFEKLIKES